MLNALDTLNFVVYSHHPPSSFIKITLMKQTKKQWTKPALKSLPIFFECTCYAGAV
jgi:hypothetical protein